MMACPKKWNTQRPMRAAKDLKKIIPLKHIHSIQTSIEKKELLLFQIRLLAICDTVCKQQAKVLFPPFFMFPTKKGKRLWLSYVSCYTAPRRARAIVIEHHIEKTKSIFFILKKQKHALPYRKLLNMVS